MWPPAQKQIPFACAVVTKLLHEVYTSDKLAKIKEQKNPHVSSNSLGARCGGWKVKETPAPHSVIISHLLGLHKKDGNRMSGYEVYS